MGSLKILVSFACLIAFAVAGDVTTLETAENGYLFEGDMVLSKEDIEQSISGGPSKQENSFGLARNNNRRWRNGVVPYTFATSIKTALWRKSSIKKAMKMWEDKTCIRFKERTDETNYIEFFADFGKCYSNVGQIGGKQRISLGFGCFGVGTAIHEIGHALGMWHEQSRPDRDNYIEINWDNIQKSAKYNFHKYSTSTIDSRGSPYDYDSIMHYPWNAFSKFPGSRTTIKSKNGEKFGQRKHISVQDAAQINKYYECGKKG